MPLDIPIIGNPRFRNLTACGWLEVEDLEISARVAELQEKKRIAHVWDGLEQRIVRAVFGGTSKRDFRHVHLDVAIAASFKRLPSANADLDEISRAVETFFGRAATIFLRGRYSLPWTDLPSDGLIRLTQATAQIAGANLSQTSAKFEIKGAASLREINWEMEDNEKDVSVEVGLLVTDTITEDYLRRLYPLVEDAWNRLALGQKPVGA